MASCTCDVNFFNTGVPGCQPLSDVVVRLILTPVQDSSGNFNEIDLGTLPSNSDILALINNTDSSKRLYPLPGMENVTNERADNLTEEFPSGKIKNLRVGVKTFSGEMIDQGAVYAGQLDGYGCTSMAAYMVDQSGNLIGDVTTNPGFLRPIRIDKDTWTIRALDTTDTTSAKVTINYQWVKTLQDGDVGFVAAGDFDGDVDWTLYNGLLDLQGSLVGSVTTTDFSMRVSTLFGSAAQAQVVSGLAQADFEIFNVTQSSSITITTMTETPAGQYNYTFPAATSADVLSLRIASGTNGYDDTILRAVEILVP